MILALSYKPPEDPVILFFLYILICQIVYKKRAYDVIRRSKNVHTVDLFGAEKVPLSFNYLL